MSAVVILKADREKPVLNQHPWVFSGAIHEIKGSPSPGEIVTVMSRAGKFLARGYYNPRSQIQVRLLTWQDEPIDEAWWRRALRRSVEARLRHEMFDRGLVTGFRLVNAESDYIPGLVVDQYGAWLVLQALTLGIDQRKDLIARLLPDVYAALRDGDGGVPAEERLTVRGVFERSDVDVRGKEGLKPSVGVLWGEAPPKPVMMRETYSDLPVEYAVDVYQGHKTGFYLDQRDNRALLLRLISDTAGSGAKRILNLFSYTGGFGIAALQGGFGQPGVVVNVDASNDALQLAEANFERHFAPRGLSMAQHAEFIQADVFELLRDLSAERQRFDVIVCDPPKFAQNAQQVERAARGYKDLNLNCFRLLNEGGFLLTFSCSGAISQDLFQKIVFGALADSGRQGQIIGQMSAGIDHPVALTFPEGAYLKGLLLRVY